MGEDGQGENRSFAALVPYVSAADNLDIDRARVERAASARSRRDIQKADLCAAPPIAERPERHAMADEKYILSYDGECERLERQSLIFGHDRGFDMVSPRPGERVLDAGCGSGWLSRLIAERMPDCEVVGVDINPDYVAYANRRAAEAGLDNLSYRVASLTDLPFAAGSFDTIFSLMVLMFLPNRQDAIAELARVAAPGGRVIAAQQGLALQLNHPPEPDLDAHLRAFFAFAFPDWKIQALPQMMETAGLRDITLRSETDPLYTFLGAATPAQLENNHNVIKPAVARMGDFLNDPVATASFVERWQAHIARPDTTTLTTFFVGTGIKP
jgi:ubiquinone/menaquinone biosynthesis C-methylase UbiE